MAELTPVVIASFSASVRPTLSAIVLPVEAAQRSDSAEELLRALMMELPSEVVVPDFWDVCKEVLSV